MNVVFFHDHTFTFLQGSYYSEGKLTDTTWSRYTRFCDMLTVVCRFREAECPEDIYGLNRTTDYKVSFDCIKPWAKIDLLISSKIRDKVKLNVRKADVVICRLPSVLGFMAFDFAKKNQKKVICEVVGCPLDSYLNHGSLLAKIVAPFMYRKMKCALFNSDFCIYVTKYFLQSRYPTKGLHCSASNVSLTSHDHRVFIKKHVRKIMFIGSLSSDYKGFADLINAFHVLTLHFNDVELHVLGSGNRSKYTDLISRLGLINKIHFYNPLPGGDAVLDWLSAGDIYVQPSHTEGLPRSLIEAMSVGLPCVGTNVGGIPELLDSICLVPPKDVHALSEALKIIISNYELRKEQSRINLVKSASYHIDVLNSVRDQFLRENVF